MHKVYQLIVRIIVLLILVYGWLNGQGIRGLECENFYLMNQSELSLKQRIKEAEGSFSRDFSGTHFLTGYLFEAINNGHATGNYIIGSETPVSQISHRDDCLEVHHYRLNMGEQEDSVECPVQRAVIFLHKKRGNRSEIVDVSVLSNECKYKIKRLPLYWFGKIRNPESMIFLKGIFKGSGNRTKKHLIAAIAFHNHPSALDFIYGIATGNYSTKLRKSAVFWMGVVKGEKCLDYLKKIYKNESEFDVRKQVIFSLYLHGSTRAVEALVKIAKKDVSVSLRKKAVFWLGQKASKECIKTLKEVITSDDEMTVKSSAVFAISQLPGEKAVPMLIDIAKKNRSPKIRKKAIFWLGQIGDKRAVEFFEDILLK